VNAQRIAGMTALIAGAIVVVGILAPALVGPSAFGGTGGWPIGPGMMGGRGMGPGMMGFGASGPASSAIANAPEVRVQAANFSFTPSEVQLPKNADVNLTFTNPSSTGVVHDFTVPALGIHVVVNPGETRTVGLRNLAAGRYDAFCSVPGHAESGMRASVVVD
jgi:heme/copper-type cytochrome/quinol oxidase subunit 2